MFRIRSISIKGFKSFGPAPQAVSLSRLTCLVGANASGKSNFVDGLRFLKDSVNHNVQTAIDMRGGFREVRCKKSRAKTKPRPIGLKLELELPVTDEFFPDRKRRKTDQKLSVIQAKYELSILGNMKSGQVQVDSEKLVFRSSAQERWKPSLLRDDRTLRYWKALAKNEQAEETGRLPVSDSTQSVLAISSGFFNPLTALLRFAVDGWHFYQFDPHQARLEFRDTDQPTLGSRGEYLSVLLHRAEKKKGENGHIEEQLRELVPGFQGFQTKPVPTGKRVFLIKEEGLPSSLLPESVSDGTVRLLCYSVLANLADERVALLVFEEPENGLHPYAVDPLIELLREVSDRSQVLFTTHSPQIVNKMAPGEVIMFDKDNGLSVVHRASQKEDIEMFLEHFRLGDLWTQGQLWGNPS